MCFWILFYCIEIWLNIRDDINVLFVEGKDNLILLLWNVNKYLLIVYFGNLKIKKIKKIWKCILENYK